MEITHHVIDLARHAELVPEPRPGNMDDLPQDIIEKRPGDLWLVSHEPIYMDRPIRWFNHQKGTHVVIPLFPYVLSPEPTRALGFMLQMGIRCSIAVGRPVRKLHLALGHPVNQFVGDPQLGDGWQFYVGFGLVLE